MFGTHRRCFRKPGSQGSSANERRGEVGGGPGGTGVSESRPSWGPLRFRGQHRAEPLSARGVGKGVAETWGSSPVMDAMFPWNLVTAWRREEGGE